MRFFKNAIACLMLAVAVTPVFTSCGNDEDEEEAPQIIKAENLFEGTTQTWPVDNPSQVYTGTRNSTYDFILDAETSTAKLVITDADFLQGMPALDPMTFPGISYVVVDNVVKLSCASLTPEIGGRPISAFPISNLQAKLVPDKSLDLQFVCDYRGTPYMVVFKGTPVR